MYPFTNNSYQIPMPFDNPNVNLRQTFNPSSQFQEITQENSLLNTDEVYDQTWLQIQDLFFKLQSIQENKRASSSSNELRNESLIRKKDRHTKINTAHGMRDRRMRLSLDVARKFFDLHDFLGFDKASKTVEWLLIKCNPAIKEIKRGETSQGNIDESSTNEFQKPSISKNIKKRSHFKKKEKKKGKVHLIGQESRKNARERARKRTTEKRKVSDFNEAQQLLGEQLHVAANNWNPCDDVCFWKENEDISYENYLVDFQIGDKAWGDCNKLKQMW